MAADPSTSLRTGAFSTPKVHKVRLTFWNLAISEASADAVVILVPLAHAARSHAGSATGSGVQDFFDAVVQFRAIHTSAIPLTKAAAYTQQKHQVQEATGHFDLVPDVSTADKSLQYSPTSPEPKHSALLL